MLRDRWRLDTWSRGYELHEIAYRQDLQEARACLPVVLHSSTPTQLLPAGLEAYEG